MSSTTEQNGLVYASSKEEIVDVVCGLIDEAQCEYVFDRRKHDRHSLAVLIKATPIKDGRFGAANRGPYPRHLGRRAVIRLPARLTSRTYCCDFRASCSGP